MLAGPEYGGGVCGKFTPLILLFEGLERIELLAPPPPAMLSGEMGLPKEREDGV